MTCVCCPVRLKEKTVGDFWWLAPSRNGKPVDQAGGASEQVVQLRTSCGEGWCVFPQDRPVLLCPEKPCQ